LVKENDVMEISLNEQVKLERYDAIVAENAALRADNVRMGKELAAAVEDMKYYLDNNESDGVVFIPKFVAEKIIKGRGLAGREGEK
jgi:predicted RecA/RadA family phage recombinase